MRWESNALQSDVHQPWLPDVSAMKAYMVCGPEASGNRYMVQLLIDAGCSGIAGYKQPVDGPGYRVVVPPGKPEMIAFVRSYPHANTWPDIVRIKSDLNDYDLTVIVMNRDTAITAQSQVRAGHVGSTVDAYRHIFRARKLIYQQISESGVRWFPVDYPMLSSGKDRINILRSFGLRAISTTSFIDGDRKYDS